MDFKQNTLVKIKEKYVEQFDQNRKEKLTFLRYTTKSKSYASVQHEKGTFQIESDHLEADM